MSNITLNIIVEGLATATAAMATLGAAAKDTAKQFEDLATPVKSAWTAVSDSFEKVKTAAEPVGESINNLGEHFKAFGESVKGVFERVGELQIGIAGLNVGLVELTKTAAENVVETDNMAHALGMTVENLEALRLAGARAGVDQENLNAGLTRFSVSLGRAREEQIKLTGQLDTGVQVLRGMGTAASSAAAGVEVLRGGVHTTQGVVGDATTVLRGGVQAVYDFSNGFKALGIDINKYANNQAGNNALLAEAAKRLQALQDSSVKASIAMQLFGRRWVEIVPVMADFSANVAKAEKTIEELGIGLSKAEIEQAKAFNSAWETMIEVVTRAKDMIGNAIGAALVPILEALTEVIGTNAVAFRDWAASIINDLVPAFQDLVKIIKGEGAEALQTEFGKQLLEWAQAVPPALHAVGVAFSAVMSVLDGVAAAINFVFGTNISGKAIAIVAVLGTITGAFTMIAAAVTAVISIFGVLFTVLGGIAAVIGWPATLIAGLVALTATILYTTGIWDNFVNVVKAFWNMLVALSNYVDDQFAQQWHRDVDNITAWWVGMTTAITDAWNSSINFITGVWNSFTGVVEDGINALVGWFQSLWDKVKAVASAIGSVLGSGAGTSPAVPMQTGGRVSGPSGTDNVSARLTAGEYVHRVAAVQHYGTGFMDRINSLSLPRFAAGGWVAPLTRLFPAVQPLQFAGGGRVSGGSIDVHLHMGGDVFNMKADDVTAASLLRTARRERMTSGGVKPSWYGGRFGGS